MKTYYLKIKVLTPLHIGTGEDYEPTNFVIDGGKLYEFDESDFYASLDASEKAAFNAVVSQSGPDMLFRVHSFVKRHKEKAKEAAHTVVEVSDGIAKDYDSKIGKAVQQEGKGGRGPDTRKVFNRFQIARSQHLVNFRELYIPGSSFKGALSTAWQEWLYKHDRRRWEKEFDQLKNPTFSPMKNLLIGDCVPLQWRGEIGYALNKERFEDDEQGPKNKLEVIKEGAVLATTVAWRSLEPSLRGSFEEFARACNEHYGTVLESIVRGNDHIHEYLDKRILETLQNIVTDEKKFLMRIGKHSGARSVSIDKMRSILVKTCDIRNKRNEGDDSEKRIDRLHRKSYFEEKEKIIELLIDENKLSDKERKLQKDCIDFLNRPNNLEQKIRNRKSMTIKCFLKEETTTWLYGERESQTSGLAPFGWVLCEVVGPDEYEKMLEERERCIDEAMNERRQEIERAQKEALECQKEREQEAARKAEEEARRKAEAEAEAARLASLSPVDRLLEEHDTNELIRMMQNGEIENYDAVKMELARKIKTLLQKDPKKWERAKQKALKRKTFIQEILGEK